MLRKRTFIIGSFVLAGVCFWRGRSCTDSFLQNIYVELFGLFLALAVGLIVVNVFLENTARKRAVRSLLQLCNESIARFHNDWLTICWAKFGKDAYGTLGTEYIKGGGKPEVLKKDTRRDIYSLVDGNTELRRKIDALDETMTEVSRLAGWSLDPSLLSACLDTRRSIGKFREVVFDGSDPVIDQVTEHILDIDFQSQTARMLLLKMAGITDE